MTKKPHKHAGGRPYGSTDYKPEYDEKVIKWGKLGKSKAWMCAEFDCTPQTMANWCQRYPSFLEAITRALKHSQKWWEDKGQDSLEKAGFQASVWSRSMAARFPDDWREKTSQELTGPDGKPLNTAPTIIFTGAPAGTPSPEAVDGTAEPSE